MNKNLYKNKYLIYCRKSTDDADSQKNSIEYQKKECLRYAIKRKLPIATYNQEYFCQDGIITEKHSASKTGDIYLDKKGNVKYKIERPKFQKLVILLQKNMFKGVIFLCWDRATRNDPDGIIIKKLIEKEVDIHFVETQYEKSSSGALHMDVDDVLAKHYSRRLQETIKKTFRKLRDEGKCTYVSPIGYIDAGRCNKTINPKTAPIIKKIFEMYATGNWSTIELAKWANKQGLTTKPVKRKRTKKEIAEGLDLETLPKLSRPINENHISGILKNPFYIGKIKYKEQVLGGQHPAIIDASLFNKVQKILKQKTVSVYYFDRKFSTYRGLIRCKCGRAYSAYEQKGIIYYQCKCLPGCSNKIKNVRESNFHDAVMRLLDKISFTKAEIAQIEAEAQDKLYEYQKKRTSELEMLNNEEKRIYKDLDYLKKNKITLLRENIMSPAEYSQDSNRLLGELEEVKNKKKSLEISEREMLDYILSFSELMKNASLYYKHALDQEKREFAFQVFSELVYYNGEIANYTAKDGFAVLLNRPKSLSGGP